MRLHWAKAAAWRPWSFPNTIASAARRSNSSAKSMKRNMARNSALFPTDCSSRSASRARFCAAGLRTSAEGFFSERYLDTTVETALAGVRGRPVARERIFETSTFASRSPRARPAFRRPDYRLGRGQRFRVGLLHHNPQALEFSRSAGAGPRPPGSRRSRPDRERRRMGELLRSGARRLCGEPGLAGREPRRAAAASRQCVRSMSRCADTPRATARG